MNYQHLEYFLKAAEYQHYTRAAEELHITQPALTKALRGMEEELGAPLFKKSGRNIELTKYGNIFLTHVRCSLKEINDGVLAVKRAVSDDQNIVKLTALYTSTGFLQEKKLQFYRSFPGYKLDIAFKYTTATIHDISNHASTFGICGEFNNESVYPGLEKSLLYTEPVKIIANKKHPLALKQHISPKDLENERFAVYNMSHNGTNKLLLELCHSAGFEPKVLITAYNEHGILNEVLLNGCIAIMTHASFYQSEAMGLAELHVDTDIPMVNNINLAWRKDTDFTPAEKAFLDLLLPSCPNAGPK